MPMITNKLLALFIAVSLAGHALLLSLATHIGRQMGPRPEHVLTVDLTMPAAATRGAKKPSRPAVPHPPEQPARPEDSVTLEGGGGPYDTYLLSVRKRIERLWHYPPRALAEKQEGNAVIRFTIDAKGRVTACSVTDSSGSAVLDEDALTVVRRAAPYSPFPGNFQIARLNITAIFSYQIGP